MSIWNKAFALTLISALPMAVYADTDVSYTNYVESLFTSVNELNIRLDRQMAQLRERFPGPRIKFTSVAALSESGELVADSCPVLNTQVEEKQTVVPLSLEGLFWSHWRCGTAVNAKTRHRLPLWCGRSTGRF